MSRLLERVLLAVGVLLYHAGLAGAVRRLRRAPRVLLYHAIAGDEDDFLRGLDSTTAPATFDLHLDYLAKHHPVVPLAVLEAGRCPPRAAVVTFDDGYRSVLQEAWPRLRARGMPAALYVVTDALDGRPVWVNELAWLVNRHEPARRSAAAALGLAGEADTAAIVAAARAHYAADAVARLLGAVRHAAGHPSAEAAASDCGLYVSWEEARTLAREGCAIGSHTASHPALGLAPDAEVREELVRSREAVAREVGACTSLACPFGDHDERTAAAAQAAGYRSMLLVGGSSARGALAVGRVPVRATSEAALFAELEVVSPLKALARGLLRGS